MSFWSSNKIHDKRKEFPDLIRPFDPDSVKQGAYEMTLGVQGAVTGSPATTAKILADREPFCIPTGQFGLMLTKEIVDIPSNVLGFISLKTKIKSNGLVNVSGFHVDPGFRGRLKFWVYNAGSQDITILSGDPVFLIWFSDLDQPTSDPYPNSDPKGVNEITAEDLRRLQGNVMSPAALAKRIEDFEHKLEHQSYLVQTLIYITGGLAFALAAPLFERLFSWLR